jgi:hypothetical protein
LLAIDHLCMNTVADINKKYQNASMRSLWMSSLSRHQYHYESRKRRVMMRFVHAIGKTWYKVLYQHTMYVIRLSNISIKTNFNTLCM